MDFGLVSLDSLVTPQLGFTCLEQKPHGSECTKQDRSFGVNENDLRNTKKSKTEELSTMRRNSSSVLFDSLPQQHMLSFSSPKSDPFSLNSDYYHPAYTRNAGLSSASLGSNMYGAFSGDRGPFTPSQWMELEHQALIYKYINANVPIPSNLLIPIRKALYPSGFSAYSASFRPSTFGWGSFHMGFSGNNDPEPGRCRRTDGKKWRCSRDAVADQKYCERHMNRGRHRSRKPVEGQTGQAAAGPANAKVIAMASSSPAVVASSGVVSNSLSGVQHVNSLQPGAADLSSNSLINSCMSSRNALKNGNSGGRLRDSQGLSMLSPTMGMKSKDSAVSSLKQESSRVDFGLASSDSLLDASQRNSYVDCRNFGSSDLDNQEPRSQDPLRHFIDDWPKNRSDHSTLGWSDVEENQSERTQLSISIPMSSDFSSSSSSPTHDKLALSPLRLSREFDPIQMGLGLGSFANEQTQRQANWIPISWESSMGGPLGEVLNHTSGTYGNHKNSSSPLSLMTEGWNAGLQMELSPTGVLRKTSFGSLSNSSTGSSPRAENNLTREQGSLCDSMLT